MTMIETDPSRILDGWEEDLFTESDAEEIAPPTHYEPEDKWRDIIQDSFDFSDSQSQTSIREIKFENKLKRKDSQESIQEVINNSFTFSKTNKNDSDDKSVKELQADDPSLIDSFTFNSQSKSIEKPKTQEKSDQSLLSLSSEKKIANSQVPKDTKETSFKPLTSDSFTFSSDKVNSERPERLETPRIKSSIPATFTNTENKSKISKLKIQEASNICSINDSFTLSSSNRSNINKLPIQKVKQEQKSNLLITGSFIHSSSNKTNSQKSKCINQGSSFEFSDDEEIWHVANEVINSSATANQVKRPISEELRNKNILSLTSSPSPIKKPPTKRICKYIVTSSSPIKSSQKRTPQITQSPVESYNSSKSPIKSSSSELSIRSKRSPPQFTKPDSAAPSNSSSSGFNLPPPQFKIPNSTTSKSPSSEINIPQPILSPQFNISSKPDSSTISSPPHIQQRNFSSATEKKRQQNNQYHTLLLATQKPTLNEPIHSDSQSLLPQKKAVKPIVLSFEQEYVLKQVLSGTSLFYTGCAGTGKSVLLKSIIKELRNKFSSGVAVTASTGLAACNIGGITLHSFAGMGLANGKIELLLKKVKKNKKAVKRWIETRVLIIDEISMIDGELFDKLNHVAKKLRKNDKPFGGIQIVACGDFYQLPPVVKKVNPDGSDNSDVKTVFSFESDSWEESIQQTIILQEIFRQKGDQTFIGMLNEIRDGKISTDSLIEFSKLQRDLDCSNGILPAELYPTRREVDAANSRRLKSLPGDVVKYKSIDTGSIQEPQRSQLLGNFLANSELQLKTQAQVMCIKNFDEALVNGSLGQVIDFVDRDTYMKTNSNEMIDSIKDGKLKDFIFNDDDKIETTGEIARPDTEKDSKRKLSDDLLGDFKNTRYPLVKFLLPDGVSTRTVVVEPEQWTVEDEEGNVLLSRVQFPLMLAWSLSIHKSQGQTLSKVKVDLRRTFENGQAYVALSRATSRNGLQVLNFNESKVMTHPKVVKFYQSLTRANDHKLGQQKLPFKSRLTTSTATI
ncbi:unnamed protein product [Candida verbasci]|uniref:ATP-dependent DNA helicase PIF1 n=1 Tax=Candida verbasci TaxID=1227364 RepID=A0A9W4TSQ7_9ASCO|nr:unnamed protein product [Candida verbasci]